MDPINKILLGVGAAIVAVIAFAFLWLAIANAHLKAQLAGAQANMTACHIANDDFAATALRQNQAIGALKTRADAQMKQARIEEAAAQKIMRKYYLAAEKIGAAQPHGDACRAAGDLIDTYIRGGS
ncbi:MAG: hypothetical protein P4M15_13465 [Alphaproteobacteria bacterium]|nr:hypothetical protein [Alphaproteobacteria bacterium]